MNIPFLNKIPSFVKITLVLGILLVSDVAFSTHIVGGEMTYRHLRDDIFEISLTIRRDCIFGAEDAQFDNPAMIAVYTGDGRLATWVGEFGFLKIPFNGDDTLNTVITSDCTFVGQQVCVQESKYLKEIRLPYRTAGYQLSYQRCCRNITLNNVVEPTNTGSTYTIFISGDAIRSGNSTPNFNQWGDIYLCANEQLTFDHSATDVDGDSLVYKLCAPYSGASEMFPRPDTATTPPYDQVVYFPPYDVNDPMGGVPLEFNAETGLLTAVPNTVGQFLIGLCVEEYRNGQLLSVVRRDFEYNVRICADRPEITFEAENPVCNDYTTTFENTSTGVDQFKWYFNFPDDDPQFTSTEVNPTFTFPEAGTYLVMLEGTRNEDGCTATFSQEITVLDNILEVDFTAELASCGDNIYSVSLTDQSEDIIDPGNVLVDWQWTVATDVGDFSGQGQMTTIEFEGIEGIITLEITAANGCTNSGIMEFTISDLLPTPDFNAFISECLEDGTYTLNLNDNSENQSDITSFEWSIDVDGETVVLSGPSVNLNIGGNESLAINYIVAYNNGCVSELDTTLDIASIIPTASFTESISCNDDGTVNLELVSTSNLEGMIVTSNWTVSIDGQTNAFEGNNVQFDNVSLNSIIVASLEVTYINDCVSTAEKSFEVADLLPKAQFSTEVTSCNEDGTVDVTFTNTSDDLENIVTSSWDITIGANIQSFTGNEVTITDVNEEDLIDITLNVSYNNNCDATINSSISVKDILPVAIVDAQVGSCNDDNTVDITLSNGYVATGGISTISWMVDFGNVVLTSTDEVFNIENVSLDATIIVTLDVEYNNGCSASVVTEIVVADILPKAQFSADITQCNEDGTYEVTITDVSGNTSSVDWSISVNGTSQDYSGSPVIIVVNPEDIITIVQSVSFNNGCDSQVESSLDVASLLPGADLSAEITSCNEDGTVDIVLIASTSDKEKVTNYTWTVSVDGSSSTYNGSQVMLSDINTNAVLNITLDIDFSTACSASTEKSLDVADLLPKADFEAIVSSCNVDGTVDLTFINISDNAGNVTSAEWEITINGDVQSLSGNEVTISNVNEDAMVEVTLMVTYNSNCDASITRSVNIEDILPQAIINAQVSSCSDDDTANVILTNGYISPFGVASISWMVDLGDEVLTSDQEEFEIENIDIDAVIVVALDVVYNNGCSASTVEEISIADILPMARYNAEVTECKEDGTFEVTISDTSGDITDVTWSIAVNGESQDYTGTPVVLVLNEDDILVITQAVNFSNGCSDTKESTLNVSDLIPNAEINAEIAACNEDGTADVTLTYSSNADDVTSVMWEVTVDGVTTSSTDDQIILPGLSLDSEVSVALDLEFASSCAASATSTFVVSDLLPEADFEAIVSSCNEDGTVDLTFINISDNVENVTSAEWEITINGDVQSLSGNEVTISNVNEDAMVEVTLMVTYNSNCDASITRSVNIEDILPQAIINAQVSSCSDDDIANVILTNGYTSPFGVASISWMVDLGDEVLTSDQEEFEIENIAIDAVIVVALDVVYNNGCSASTVEEISIADILPMARYNAEVTECKEDGTFEVTISDTSGDITDVTWSIAVNGESQDYTGTPVVLVLNEDDILVITQAVNFSNGCSDTKESTLNVSDLIPNAEINAEIATCNEDGTADVTLTYSSNADDVTSVMWEVTVDGVSTSSTDDQIFLPGLSLDSEVSVALDLEFASSCAASATSTFVVSDLLPQAKYVADLVSCPDDENIVVRLTESSDQSSSSVSWMVESNGEIFTGTDTSLIIQVNKNSTTLVTLDVIFESGCTSTLNDTLNIENLLPTPEFSTSVDECPAVDSVTMVISDATSVDNEINSWDWIISFAGEAFTYNTSSFSVTVPRDSIVSVSLTVGLENGCILILENGSFLPGPLPEVEFISDTVTGCLGDTVKLVSNPDPSQSYTWDPEEGLIFDNPDDRSDPSVVISGDMTYNVTVTDGSCQGTGSVSVAIDPNTTISVSGDSTTCDGTIEMVASGGQGNGTFEWSTTPDFEEIIFEGDTLQTNITDREETFWIRLVNSTCNAEPVSFTVKNATPDLAYLDPFEICRGDTLNYIISNLDPDQELTFLWEDDPHIISGDTTNSPLIGIGIEEMDSFYLVFNVVNQYGCELSDSVFVQIIENPEISFTPQLEECGAYTVCFEITSEFNGTPLWDFGDPESGFMNASIDEMPCHTYPGPGDYTVSLSTLSNYCASAMDQQVITLTEAFTVDTIANQSVCPGDTVNLTASASVEGLDFVWCTPEGDTLSTGIDFTYVADTNDVQVILKAFDFFGCSDTSEFTIDVFNFDIQFNIPDVLCNGEQTQISVTNSTGGDLQYMWGPEDAIISGEETDSPVVSVTETTDLTLSVFEATAGCLLDTVITVTASSITATIDAIPGNEINEGEDVVLDVNSDADIVDYEWSDPSLNGNPVTVEPTENTTYTVTVTDENGCTAVASIDISVRQAVCNETDVFIPNAFSPNNDGVNDVFRVRSNFIEEMELIVYNRWGQEVFRSTDQDTGWDGTFNGDLLSPDVYGFRLEVLCINDVVYITKGNVSLLR